MAISFKAKREEIQIIWKIADRAVKLAADIPIRGYDSLEAQMDVTACHCSGCPLDLTGLLESDDATFGHDVFGIRKHINRKTGELQNCFLPRTAKPAPQKISETWQDEVMDRVND